MDSIVVDYLGGLTESFVDPKKRVFVGYLAVALAIACVVMLGAARWNLRAGAGLSSPARSGGRPRPAPTTRCSRSTRR